MSEQNLAIEKPDRLLRVFEKKKIIAGDSDHVKLLTWNLKLVGLRVLEAWTGIERTRNVLLSEMTFVVLISLFLIFFLPIIG